MNKVRDVAAIVTKIKFYDSLKGESDLADEIFTLLKLCDTEFIPPLSARLSTRQKDLHESINVCLGGEPLIYLHELLKQKSIIAFIGNNVVAFMSFIHEYDDNNVFSEMITPNDTNNYISTICTNPNFRGQGIARQLYDFIEKELPNEYVTNFVSTRTWSSNKSHIKILNNRGYTLTHTEFNDRKEDNISLDTVYFCKRII